MNFVRLCNGKHVQPKWIKLNVKNDLLTYHHHNMEAFQSTVHKVPLQ